LHPFDPFYLSWIARQFGLTTQFIELAGEVKVDMPGYVVCRITDGLNVRAFGLWVFPWSQVIGSLIVGFQHSR
jgi:UDP-N-acetyl-D-mannosaminuronate dehydrogenase